jgi:LCP family protein required for cell wall assembly
MPAKTSSRRTSASSGYDFNEAEHDLSTSSRGSRSAGHGLAKPKKKRKKVRSPLWAKLTATLGVLITLIGFGGVAAAKSLMGDLTGSIEVGSTTEDSTNQQTKQKAGTALKGAIDILLLGLDTRAGWAENTSRADTIILLHIPASHDQAYLISIPRDAEVPIPSWSKAGFNGMAHDKINSAYFFGSQRNQGWTGGAGLMKKTVSELTGITFDGVVVIDFGGFRNVIAALGGVYMCVERDTWSSHYVSKNGKPQYITYHGDYKLPNSWIHKKGCRNMAPWEALDYSRQRYGLPNSDYDRQRHQQQLLRSMAKKATSAGIITNPLKLGELTKAAGSSLKMDTNRVPLDDFIFTLKALAGSDLVALKTNAGTYAKSSVGTGEGITEGTREMFTAAKEDRLGEFIMENPQYLISDKQSTVASK